MHLIKKNIAYFTLLKIVYFTSSLKIAHCAICIISFLFFIMHTKELYFFFRKEF